MRKFAADLSLQIFLIHYISWWNVLVANLATNFQDLVAKVKNLVALAPVLGAISRPEDWGLFYLNVPFGQSCL